jgi:hypothetical protein
MLFIKYFFTFSFLFVSDEAWLNCHLLLSFLCFYFVLPRALVLLQRNTKGMSKTNWRYKDIFTLKNYCSNELGGVVS